ncbi:DinB family protein [Kribbella sp. NPDC023855]|uniref:DinB family protein n=1 Tax=Kribbella sp. NPDC023855 TaxID=3154698 RepID=UPI00340D1395
MTEHDLPHEAPIAGTELETMLGSLERQRAIFAWKCGGLDSVGLQASHPPSKLSLGGLVKHLALVEDEYFTRRLLGRELGAPWDAVDWDADPDWEWHSAAEDSPEELYALWQEATDRSRTAVAAVLDRGGLDQLAPYKNGNGESPSLRRIMIDLIEEYARHAGHADLIRESVDGLTGEDPPRS